MELNVSVSINDLGINMLRLAFVCLCKVVCGGGAPGFGFDSFE